MDFKKLEKRSIKLGISEKLVWLLDKYEAKPDELELYVKYLLKAYKICGTKYCGEYTTTGGAPIEDITIGGVEDTQKCVVVLKQAGVTPVTVLSAKCGAGKITVTYSANPAADHTVTYMVL